MTFPDTIAPGKWVLVLCAGLSGCFDLPSEQPQAEEGARMIDCALGEGSLFGPGCLVEQRVEGGKTLLIVRHMDGGFRVFESQENKGGYVNLSGADEAENRFEDGILHLRVAEDRYRFPADMVWLAPEAADQPAQPDQRDQGDQRDPRQLSEKTDERGQSDLNYQPDQRVENSGL